MSDNTRPPPQPSSLITQRSCADFQDLESFKDCLASIAQVKEHHEFVLLDIPRDWADIVFEVLDEVVSAREHLRLINAALQFPSGPYHTSRKEPDFLFMIRGRLLPTVAVESGWSDPMPRLQDDLNMLLVGGDGSIKVVIIIKWSRHAPNRVSGVAELYKCDRNGIPVRDQREVIFPHNPTTGNQQLVIKRRDLLGSGHGNPAGSLFFDLDLLRDFASRALGRMNLVPA
ncbi:hypothetical protein N7534_005205 [Penicillium rubens]|nr:hypothetical protein N7534_005205 [Penicillium rubens]